MIAETAVNVIDALSPQEKQRLFKLLNIEPKEQKAQPKKLLFSDTQIREMIISQAKRFVIRHKQRNG